MKKKSIHITLAVFLVLIGIYGYPPTSVLAKTEKLNERTLTEISPASDPYVNQTPTFSDVPKTFWAYKEIQSLKDRGIAEAFKGDNFMPNAVMTRATAARMLVKAKGISITDSSLDDIWFIDVPKNDPNLKYIQAAKKHGIFGGYPGGTFGPNEPLTRAQMASVLVKTFDLKESKSNYIIMDVNTNHWAFNNIHTLASLGITEGYDVPGKSERYRYFKPEQSNTRAQMAIFVYRTLNIVQNGSAKDYSHLLDTDLNASLFEYLCKNDIDAVRFLLANGADPNGYVSVSTIKKFFTYSSSTSYIEMLYPAIASKNLDMIQLLIDSGADVTKTIYFSDTALKIAIDSGDAKLAELLLETNKINPEGLGVSDGYSYLAYAIKKNQIGIAKLLVQFGSVPYKRFGPEASTSWGSYYNPYEYALGLNRTELVNYFQSWSWKNDYQAKNVDITKIKRPDREFLTPQEFQTFLNDNFSYVYTPVGKTKLSFFVIRGSHGDYDYWIQTLYDNNFFNDVGKLSPNKYYDVSTREEVKRLLKEHQEKIGTVLNQINQSSKLYGGYYHSFYRYPTLKVDLITFHYFSWKNYGTNPTERYFRWDPLIDNEL
jgi:ankyrin repeat protein